MSHDLTALYERLSHDDELQGESNSISNQKAMLEDYAEKNGYTPLYRNVNRLIDTKGMNRISGKPLKTRGSGTRAVAGIPCLLLGPCQGSMGAAVANSHSGRKSDPSVAVLPPAAKGLPPMAVNVPPVVTVFDPSPCIVQRDPSASWRIYEKCAVSL
jgi:hypothetical protein